MKDVIYKRWTAGRLLGAILVSVLIPGLAAAVVSEIWARQLGGPDREHAAGVAVDRLGTAFVVGPFERTAAFDSTSLTSAGLTDVFVAALDRLGKVTWARSIGGAGADEARAVAVGPDGEVYVTGFFSGTVDFDPGPGRTELVSAGASDVFVVRLSPRGELVWARRFGGAQADAGLDVAVDARGIYVAGSFQGSLEAGAVRLESAGRTDAFLVQLDLTGSPQWARRLGGPKSDDARSVSLEPDGQVWVAGSFEDKASFGPAGGTAALESAGDADAFLARLGADGALLWSGRLGGPQTDVAEAVTAGSMGVWVTGRFARTADFDPGPTSTSMSSMDKTDGFVARFAVTGHLRWVRQIGGRGHDFGTGIVPDRYGGVWVTGVTEAKTGQAGPDPEWGDDRSYLTHFDREGERKTTRDMAAAGGLRVLDLTLDAAANPCVAGAFRGQATVITGFEAARLPGAGKTDALVARIAP